MISIMYVKKMRFFLFFLAFVSLCLCACKPKDFSVNAKTEPFTVVYGLLNSNDKVHYIKIFKSFVVEGNAYDVVKDINMYSYMDSIDVYLNEYNSKNQLYNKFKLDTTTAIPKDSGLFLYPTQILYTTNVTLKEDYLYEIEIFNPYTKNTVKVKAPVALAGKVSINRPPGPDISITDKSMSFDFFTAKNSNMYQLILKFYYTERMMDNTERQPPPVEWVIGSIEDNSNNSGIEKKIPVSSGSIFFIKVADAIKSNENIRLRHVDSLVLEVHSAAKDWSLYIKSNLPTWGINQEKLHYSNMIAYSTETGEEKYAMGLFSSRGITTKTYRNLATPGGSLDSLMRGRFTGHLKFTEIY